MAFCLSCEKSWEEGVWNTEVITSELSGAEYGVCFVCRRHIEIGKLVEAMKDASLIASVSGDTWYFCPRRSQGGHTMAGDTPLEALTKGKKA